MDILSKNFIAKKILHIGLSDKPHMEIGTQNYLRKINELDRVNIFKKILKFANE